MPFRTAILFGGKSPEHEVSLQSAANVLAHLPKSHHPIPIYITREGAWHHYPYDSFEIVNGSLHSDHSPIPVCLPLDGSGVLLAEGEKIPLQAAFPLLHGVHGEDGSLAGLLTLAGIPYVGCRTAAGAMGMDKVFCKAYLSHFGVPTVPWRRVPLLPAPTDEQLALIEGEIPYPIFVKPALGGSSLGACCVSDREGLRTALRAAAEYGDVALCEACVRGREIEVAVLDADALVVSRPGEIALDGVYTYDEKYHGSDARLLIPAPLPAAVCARARALAARIFRLLGCRHLARVDFFVADNDLYFNEINTLPGFTEASMYPRLMEDAGYPLPHLLDTLIAFAHDRDL